MQIIVNNMKKGNKYFLIGILLLFSLTFVQAQPPFQIQPTLIQGYFIEIPDQEALKINKDYTFFFHVFNLSTGLPLTNLTVSCEFNLHNKLSTNIFSDLNLSFNEQTTAFFTEVKGGNFSSKGTYTYVTHCNSEHFGGVVSVRLRITKTGESLETSESLTYFILAFGVLILFALSFYFMISTPDGNKVDEGGAVIKLTKLKYVKLGLILLTWVLFTWFLNILIGLSDNFVSLTMYYGFFGFIFQVMNNLALPFGIIIIVIAFFEIIRDANIQKAISKFGSST